MPMNNAGATPEEMVVIRGNMDAARRLRAEWMVGVARGLIEPTQLVQHAATTEGAALLRIRLQKLLLARPPGRRRRDRCPAAGTPVHRAAGETDGQLAAGQPGARPAVLQLAGGAARHPEGTALAGFPVHRRTGDRPGGEVRVTGRVPAAAAARRPREHRSRHRCQRLRRHHPHHGHRHRRRPGRDRRSPAARPAPADQRLPGRPAAPVRSAHPVHLPAVPDHPALHADDVRQIVAMTALAMVNEHLRGELGARRFEALLTVRARSKVRAHFDSASHTPLSEMTTVKRRLRKLGEKRRQLVAELGREPSADEVVRQWNTEARTRFSDPARQAMLATVTDLVDVLHHGDPATPRRGTGPLRPDAFLGEVLAETHCADPLLGDTAAAWIGGALADPPFVRSPAEIAALLGVRPREASAAITAVRGIAGRILTDRHGIAVPTPWDAAGLSA